MSGVTSHLWFATDAGDPVAFYVSLIPNSRIVAETDLPAETPSGPPGSVRIIVFELGGQRFTALQARPLDSFNHSFSIQVGCGSQEELDRIWDGFLAQGGVPEQCGWLKDRWGLSWQILPQTLTAMIADPDRARAGRVYEAMLGMVKIDIAALERAYGR